MSLTTEQLGDLFKKNPIGIGCGILSLALVGTAYWRSDLPAQEQELLEQKTNEAERIAANLKNAAQLKEQMESLLAAQKQIEGRLIQAKNLMANGQYFYRLETETGVKLLDQRQSSSSKKELKGYVATVFTLNVQGDYKQLVTFLRRLENGTHYCRVLTASCTTAGAERSNVMTLALSVELLGQP